MLPRASQDIKNQLYQSCDHAPVRLNTGGGYFTHHQTQLFMKNYFIWSSMCLAIALIEFVRLDSLVAAYCALNLTILAIFLFKGGLSLYYERCQDRDNEFYEQQYF